MKAPYTKAGKRGNVVYQRARHGQISYPYHVPANPRTRAQQAIRAVLSVVAARWRKLTEEQRKLWRDAGKARRTRRRLGQQWRMPGFNYFVQVNVARAHRGLPLVDVPPESK